MDQLNEATEICSRSKKIGIEYKLYYQSAAFIQLNRPAPSSCQKLYPLIINAHWFYKLKPFYCTSQSKHCGILVCYAGSSWKHSSVEFRFSEAEGNHFRQRWRWDICDVLGLLGPAWFRSLTCRCTLGSRHQDYARCSFCWVLEYGLSKNREIVLGSRRLDFKFEWVNGS